MNWEAIKQIYYRILKYNDKIEYLGDDKYKLSSYYKSGKKYWRAEYKNEKCHGKIIFWYSNGNKSRESEHENGVPHGKYLLFNTNGTIRVEYEYRNGIMIK